MDDDDAASSMDICPSFHIADAWSCMFAGMLDWMSGMCDSLGLSEEEEEEWMSWTEWCGAL